MTTTDHLTGVVYYLNGTVTYPSGSGTLIVSNPAPASPLSAVNVTAPNGSIIHVGSLGPSSSYSLSYTIPPGIISLPLALKESIIPSPLAQGSDQQIRLIVQLENIGDRDITNVFYNKSIPSNLSLAWTASDGGVVCVNSTVTWTLDRLSPGEKKNMTVAFNVTPQSSLYFPAASMRYTYDDSLMPGTPTFSGTTTTSFEIQKSHPGAGVWQVNASIPDDGDFDINLTSVSIRRSAASDPFNTVELAAYAPNVRLSPGADWNTSLTDHFDPVPAYFISFTSYLPYRVTQTSTIWALTEPYTLSVTPSVTPRPTYYPPNYVYVTPTATPRPSPQPTAVPEPDILFVTPSNGDVITNNTTTIRTSVPPSGEAGYVVYYGSTDNSTWVRLGESPVSGNLSELLWAVPQMTGNYYLKAEHYNSGGLLGVAYVQVLVAHEILPVGLTTMLISGTDWLMLLLALIVLLLLALILLPYIRGNPIIYDSSALFELSRDKDWLSKLPRKTIRPDELVVEIAGVEKIKLKQLRNIDEMRRLEKEYGLQAYDAMALQLARETGATLRTVSPHIASIAKQLDVKVEVLEKEKVAVKA